MNRRKPRKLRVVIIGLGKIGLEFDMSRGNNHVLTHTKAFMNHPGYELVCGVDRNPNQRKKFNTFTGKEAYPELSAICDNDTYDVIVLAIPPEGRIDVLRQCLHLKPRLILIEKPLAFNTEEGRRIIELCNNAGSKLIVNYMRRFQPAVKKLKGQIERNLFGAFRCGHVYYPRGIYNNASHFLDLFHFLIGTPSSWGVIEKNKEDTSECDPNFDFWVSLEGHRCVFQAVNGTSYSIGRSEFLLEKATIQYDDFGRDVILKKAEKDPHFKGFRHLTHKPEKIKTDFERSQWYVAEHIYQYSYQGVSLASTGQTALKTLAICEDLIKQWRN